MLSVAVVQRDSVSIVAAAGAQPTVRGPEGVSAVNLSGAGVRLELQGLAIDSPRDGWAVYCAKKGRAELSGCTLTSPEGYGLGVYNGGTATMDGGSISGCGTRGVFCNDSGSTATVRPPAAAPSAAPPCPLRAAGAAAFFSPASPFFPAVFWPIGTAVRKR